MKGGLLFMFAIVLWKRRGKKNGPFDRLRDFKGANGTFKRVDDRRKMEAQLFCGNCGAPLPRDAASCPMCGTIVLVEAEDDSPTNVGNSRHLRSLTFFILLAIGTCFFAFLIGFFDVRVYYTFGRFGLFLIATGSLALNVWLALRISEGLNWARVTFVVISVLSCLAVASGSSGNECAYYATLIAAVLNLICAVGMFLLRSVSTCFRETRNGIKCAIIYLCSYIGFVAVVAAYTLIYQSANKDAYFNDWVAAVREGSQKARSRMIAYFIEGSNEIGSPKEIRQTATEQVDALCPKKKKDESSWGVVELLVLLAFFFLPGLYAAWMEKK